LRSCTGGKPLRSGCSRRCRVPQRPDGALPCPSNAILGHHREASGGTPDLFEPGLQVGGEYYQGRACGTYKTSKSKSPDRRHLSFSSSVPLPFMRTLVPSSMYDVITSRRHNITALRSRTATQSKNYITSTSQRHEMPPSRNDDVMTAQRHGVKALKWQRAVMFQCRNSKTPRNCERMTSQMRRIKVARHRNRKAAQHRNIETV
jgi:hypothetical protein